MDGDQTVEVKQAPAACIRRHEITIKCDLDISDRDENEKPMRADDGHEQAGKARTEELDDGAATRQWLVEKRPAKHPPIASRRLLWRCLSKRNSAPGQIEVWSSQKGQGIQRV